jgi:hypothetical protein
MTTQTPTITLNPKKVLIFLVSLIAVLVALSIRGQYVKYFGVSDIRGIPHEFVLDLLMGNFNMDNEVSVPTFVNIVILFVAALTLTAIGIIKMSAKDKYRFHWVGLAIVFFLLSMDEASGFHERLVKPMRNIVDTGGFFYFPWIIPGIIAVTLFAAMYFFFFLHLDKKYKVLFLFSLAIYIGGVIGGEMISGYFAFNFGQSTYKYALAASLEESIEMIGASLIVYSLLDYIKTHLPEGFVLKVS